MVAQLQVAAEAAHATVIPRILLADRLYAYPTKTIAGFVRGSWLPASSSPSASSCDVGPRVIFHGLPSSMTSSVPRFLHVLGPCLQVTMVMAALPGQWRPTSSRSLSNLPRAIAD
ncbi:hypothetical protein SPRG_02293, partial [Saprolegnia parasitica CBS 223.65]